MQKSTTTLIIILILLVGAVFFGVKYVASAKNLKEAQAKLSSQQTNHKVLEFAMLFIENVLKAEGEVDFEMRLQLENAVRNLNDAEIMARWTEFVESKTEAEAQNAVKNLLEILFKKIQTK
jgi:Na+-transporting NADH:ubiquinone oxidoreductase subunit NqrC